MARKGMLEAEGIVTAIRGGGWHDVLLDNGGRVRAKPSGRLRKFRIRVLVDDRVRIEVSEADPTMGFIVFRITA